MHLDPTNLSPHPLFIAAISHEGYGLSLYDLGAHAFVTGTGESCDDAVLRADGECICQWSLSTQEGLTLFKGTPVFAALGA